MKNICLLAFALFLGGCAPHIVAPAVQEQIGEEVLPPAAAPESRFRVTAPSGIVYTDMQGFFVKSTAFLPNDVNYFIATSERMFLSVFGVARTMDNVVTVPDFSKNIVLAIALKPSRTRHDVIIRDIIISGEELTLRYNVVSRGSFPHTTSFFRAIEIERPHSGIRTIVFDDGKGAVRVPYTVPRGR